MVGIKLSDGKKPIKDKKLTSNETDLKSSFDWNKYEPPANRGTVLGEVTLTEEEAQDLIDLEDDDDMNGSRTGIDADGHIDIRMVKKALKLSALARQFEAAQDRAEAAKKAMIDPDSLDNEDDYSDIGEYRTTLPPALVSTPEASFECQHICNICYDEHRLDIRFMPETDKKNANAPWFNTKQQYSTINVNGSYKMAIIERIMPTNDIMQSSAIKMQ